MVLRVDSKWYCYYMAQQRLRLCPHIRRVPLGDVRETDKISFGELFSLVGRITTCKLQVRSREHRE
jgi:hypothetical protein